MSYDVWMAIDTGAPDLTMVSQCRNYTSNCAPMWRLAGADLAGLHGRTGAEAAPIVRAAEAEMRRNPEPYIALSPPNGWGDYGACVEYLCALADDMEEHPKAIVQVSC